MAKSSKIYWAERQRQLNKALQKAEKELSKRLSAFYSQESAKLDKEIAAYYAELGEDNVVEYRKMLQHMSDADRKLLMERMDDFAKKYPEKAHLMPTRASIYKLDRLEGLQTSTKLHQMEIGAKTEEEVTRHLKQTAARSANAAAETLTGKGGSLYELNSPLVEKIVGTNWANGVSYSERIWKNTEKLADKLNSDIAAGLVRGESYDKLSKQLMTEMNIRNRSDAERLIYTEGTHVMNEASISVFQEAGFDQYIISPLPDACEYCQEIAGEQNALVERERSGVPISERVAGENFPPLHPWCRCSYEIYIEGMQRDDSVKTPENVENTGKNDIITREVDFFAGPGEGKVVPAELAHWIGDNKYKELLQNAKGTEDRRYIRTAYRKSSIIGDGGTVDARRFEIATGRMLGRNGRPHTKKVDDLVRQIDNSLKKDIGEEERAYLISERDKLKEVQGA